MTNKYRILTTKGKWLYSEVSILEDRLAMPLVDEKGSQVLMVDGELRPETLSQLVIYVADAPPVDSHIYEGDIIQRRENSDMRSAIHEGDTFIIKRQDEGWVAFCINTTLIVRDMRFLFKFTKVFIGLDEDTRENIYCYYKIIGNIHENPELMEEK